MLNLHTFIPMAIPKEGETPIQKRRKRNTIYNPRIKTVQQKNNKKRKLKQEKKLPKKEGIGMVRKKERKKEKINKIEPVRRIITQSPISIDKS